MPPYERSGAYGAPRRAARRRWFDGGAALDVRGLRGGDDDAAGARLGAAIVAGSADSQAARDAETIWKRAGSPDTRHAVDVIRTIDGDTFEARVHLPPDLNLTTRVRLRGIDAPELKASCPQELQMAEAATNALRALLGEGDVRIFNIGPDKYGGRVVADAATRRTGNVSTAMLAAGHARSYGGGHRIGWCANAGQTLRK